jgi:hypothetical protein
MDQSWFLVVSSLLQILVCSCSGLTATDHGMLTVAHLFSFITTWPNDNKVLCVWTLLCVCVISVFFSLHFQCLYLRQFWCAQNLCAWLLRPKFCTPAPNILVWLLQSFCTTTCIISLAPSRKCQIMVRFIGHSIITLPQYGTGFMSPLWHLNSEVASRFFEHISTLDVIIAPLHR